MKESPMTLEDRLKLAAQACRAAHLLSCEATCHEVATALSLAQTEINGYRSRESDLDIGALQRALDEAQTRIAELEKDAARLDSILAIWEAHRSDQYAEDPDEVDSYDRVCDLLDAALKDRA